MKYRPAFISIHYYIYSSLYPCFYMFLLVCLYGIVYPVVYPTPLFVSFFSDIMQHACTAYGLT